MQNIYRFIDKFLYSENFFWFLIKISLFLFTLNIFTGIITTDILDLPSSKSKYTKEIIKNNYIFSFIVTILIIPAVETVIFQWLPVFIYKSITQNNSNLKKTIFILSSSAIFGLLHSYDIIYQIRSFFAGISYITLTFFLADRNKNYFTPIFIAHSFNNFTVFILKILV